MGIGFPRLGMGGFARGYGALLPGTWYLTARIDQTVRGTPSDLSWPPVLILAAFVIGLAGLTAWRLEGLRARRRRARSMAVPGGNAS
jgi:ABC-2 type transport system permease protein